MRALIGWRASWPVRVGVPLLIVVAAATVAVYLLRPVEPSAPGADSDQAAPLRPGPVPTGPASAAPEFSPVTATPATAPTTTITLTARPPTPAGPRDPATAAEPPAGPPGPIRPGQPGPPATPTWPGTPPASSVTQPPPAEDAHLDKINLPGEPTIYCPTPYVGSDFGPIARCTQQSGDQVRTGFYSPFALSWGPTSDWMTVVDTTWHDGMAIAADGVEGTIRGYGAVNTPFGAAVLSATQYRQGEGRWGNFNLVTGRFYPESVGWLPAAF